jgi:hypothetical protein
VSKGIVQQLLDNPDNRPTFVAGVVSVFLLLLWLVEIMASPEPIVLPPPTAADAGALPDTSMAAAVDIPSLAEYESVIERPLFSEDRLPSEDEDADAEDEVVAGNAQAPPMQLAGVVLTGEHQIAMLTREGRPLRVEVGMDVDGWVLEGLEPRRAILSNGINSVELELPLYAAPAAPRGERPSQRSGGSMPGNSGQSRGRGRSKQAQPESSPGQSSAQTGEAMNVRERIQQAREERERMRQDSGQQQDQGGKKGSGQGRRPGG